MIMSNRAAAYPSYGPELVFGLAGAVGTDLEAVSRALDAALTDVGYTSEEIRLSELLDEVDWTERTDAPAVDDSTIDRHIDSRMEAGDRLREALQRGDALALLSIYTIFAKLRADPETPTPRRSYILRSLKHPQEVEKLREVYGPHFLLISAYAPADARADRLIRQIAAEWERVGGVAGDSPQGRAWNLIERDKLEESRPFGQRLGATFPMADFFIDSRRQQDMEVQIARLIELLFDHPFHTPTRDENAMFHAHAAALRSSAPGRQVGVAIATREGDLVVAGCNEVPKPHGGQYWADDDPDERDHRRSDPDVSGSEKRTVVEQILRRLSERGWLRDEHNDASATSFYELLDGLRVRALIEFERAVHAEMAAIVDAARRGVAVRGTYLYTTTFPCHECTRHIIAAGVERVVYIEPYPKSLAPRLHDDAISIDEDAAPSGKVRFEPFVGVGPRKYMELFTARPGARRDNEGRVAPARAGWLPKGVPMGPISDKLPTEPAPSPAKTTLPPTEALPEGLEDEVKEVAEVIEQTFDITSDHLYIVREKNALFELTEALKKAGMEVKE
jgi:cytidine deaminase